MRLGVPPLATHIEKKNEKERRENTIRRKGRRRSGHKKFLRREKGKTTVKKRNIGNHQEMRRL